jgi:hypothetical protein
MQEILLVGRRLLGSLFEHLTDISSAIEDVQARCLTVMEEIRREDHKPMTELERTAMGRDAETFATRFWFDLYSLATFAVVTRLSSAIGLKQLDTTMTRVRDQDDAIPNHLVDLASRLNRRGRGIPKDEIISLHEKLKRADNKLARVVLEAMLYERLTLFDTDHAVRDAVCNQMNITVPRKALDPSRKKFLPPKRSS